MKYAITKLLAGSIIKDALKRLKDNPEREIRNLVDMAAQFSDDGFRGRFFSAAQIMLQNETSGYYSLVRNIIGYVDIERLYVFGMNLGYNSAVDGARRIRKTEGRLRCNIPWAITMQIDTDRLHDTQKRYDALIHEGEELGIFSWMLFTVGNGELPLTLVKNHPESAFFLFCEPQDLTEDFLEMVQPLHNLMPVVRYREGDDFLYNRMQQMHLLYSVWLEYDASDADIICSGDLICSTQQVKPFFTALVSVPRCPDTVQHRVHAAVVELRKEQSCCTVPWELQGDNSMIDELISEDLCCANFNRDGLLCDWKRCIAPATQNLFHASLKDILVAACPKQARS